MARVMRVFLDADLRGQHPALTKLSKKGGAKPEKLKPGEYLVFINRKRNRLKVFASDGVLAYYRAPDASRIDFETISLIPQVFEGRGRLDYNEALRRRLQKAGFGNNTKKQLRAVG